MAAPPIKPPSKPGQNPLPPPVPDEGGEALDTDGLAPAAAAAGFLVTSTFELDVGPALPAEDVPVLAGAADLAAVSDFAAGSDFTDDGTDADVGLDRPPAGLPSPLGACDDDAELGVAALSEDCVPLVPVVAGSAFRA